MGARIILVRHGRTPSNESGRIDSLPPGPELSEEGRAQAVAVGRELAAEVGATNGDPGRLREAYCSIALRAGQTAWLAMRSLEETAGLPERTIPITVTEGIHEVWMGEAEGHTDDAAHQTYARTLRRWLEGDSQACLPEGETYPEVLARFQPVLERLAEELADAPSDVIIVTHGAAIRVVATHACDVDPEWVLSHYVPNCGYAILEPQGKPFGQWALTGWPDAPMPKRYAG